MPYWTPALAALTVPITFLTGARDPKYVAIGQALARAVPALCCRVVPDAGHNLALERPRAVAAAVLAQLRERATP
jgi:pimeloyl-ACP methyl ester carboxylesterase